MDRTDVKSFTSQDSKCCLESQIDKTFLQERLQFYSNENARMEAALKQLAVIEDDGVICKPQVAAVVDKMIKVQEKFEVDKFCPIAMSLAHSDHLYNKSDHCKYIQKCLEVQNSIDISLKAQLKDVEDALQNARNRINNLTVSPEELKTSQSQLAKLQTEVLRYENRHGWLKNPSFNLCSISDEIEELKTLKNEEVQLSEAVACYQDLKPDIVEARQQLMQLKIEFDKLNKKTFGLS